jgi:hypothetical protein
VPSRLLRQLPQPPLEVVETALDVVQLSEELERLLPADGVRGAGSQHGSGGVVRGGREQRGTPAATEDDEDDGVGEGLGPVGDAEIDGVQSGQIGFDYSAKALATAGGFVEVVAIVAAAAVILVGAGAALHTSTDLSGNQTHPDGVGVAAILSGVIFGVFYRALDLAEARVGADCRSGVMRRASPRRAPCPGDPCGMRYQVITALMAGRPTPCKQDEPDRS